MSASSQAREFGPEVHLHAPAYVHPTALMYGRVSVGQGSSVFAHAVLRAELHQIQIGARTNIQDFVMVHVGTYTPTIVGNDCSVTHHATLHGCEIGDRCMIGIHATVMDGAKIGPNSIVAPHALVQENEEFPRNSVIAGAPAKVVATRDNSIRTLFNARLYEVIARNYAQGIERVSEAQLQKLGRRTSS